MFGVLIEEGEERSVGGLPVCSKRRAHEDWKVGPAHVHSHVRREVEHTRFDCSAYCRGGHLLGLSRKGQVGVLGGVGSDGIGWDQIGLDRIESDRTGSGQDQDQDRIRSGRIRSRRVGSDLI